MAQPSRSALFLGFALLIAGPALATTVGGDIVTDTTWDVVGSPYEVVSTVVVRSGATLTIDPGVTVRVSAHYQTNPGNGLQSMTWHFGLCAALRRAPVVDRASCRRAWTRPPARR